MAAKDIAVNLIVGAVDNASSVLKGIGGSLADVGKIAGGIAIGGIAAAGAGIAALGKTSFDAAMTLDEAFDTITTATGATGDELEALKTDFSTVFGNVPLEAKDVADSIATLNQKLDLTGPELQSVATQVAQFAQVTGGDAADAARSLTRIMGDWDIEIQDANATLDAMFVASQQSGLGMDTLLTKLDQFGAPLKAMGYGFDESVAMMANWEKQGLGTEKMLTALNAAANNLTIQHEKEVAKYESLSTALGKAEKDYDNYGLKLQEAEVKLKEMIKSGKASTDQLDLQRARVEKIKGEYQGAGASVAYYTNEMAKGPPKMVEFNEGLAKNIEKIKQIGSDSEAVGLAIEVFGSKMGPEMAQAIREGKLGIEDMITAMQGAEGAIANTAEATEDFPEKFEKLKNKVTVALAPLGGIIMDGIGTALEALAPIITDATKWLAEDFAPIVTQAFADVKAFLEENGPAIQEILTTAFTVAREVIEGVVTFLSTVVIPAIRDVVQFIQDNWPAIRTVAEAVFGAVKSVVEGVATFITTVVVPAVQAIAQFISDNWPTISAVAETVFGVVKTVIEGVANFFTTVVIPAFQSVVAWVQENWPAIQTVIESVFGALKPFIEGALNGIKAVIGLITDAISGNWTKVWNGLKAGAEAAWASVVSFLQRLPNEMLTWGKQLLTSLAEGFLQAIGKISEALTSVFEGAFEELKKTPFFSFLEKLITGKLEIPEIKVPEVQVGIREGSPIDQALKFLGGKQHGGPVSPWGAYLVGERGPELFVPRVSGEIVPNSALAGAGGPMTINVVLDGDVIAQRTVNRMTGAISKDVRRYGWG